VKQRQSPTRAIEAKNIFSGLAEVAVEKFKDFAKLGAQLNRCNVTSGRNTKIGINNKTVIKSERVP
jgi:hypothetical protein